MSPDDNILLRLRDHTEHVEQLLAEHRPVFRARLAAAWKRIADHQPVDRILTHLDQLRAQSDEVLAYRDAHPPRIEYDDALPIAQKRDEIADAIARHAVVVVCGDTGSGKTTQIPKICMELGRGRFGVIGHTQPRRIAARAVAQRLSDEIASPLGDLVGFKVRFTDQTRPHTRVRLMTDGILLSETQNDPDLLRYDTLIIDEAHERSLNIDFLLGYLRRLIERRDDLKLIITSATIDPERFSHHFNHAPILMVEGRTYPVEVRYRPPVSDDPEDRAALLRDGLVSAIHECRSAGPGDILTFLPGEREIREAHEAIAGAFGPSLEVIPLYARLGVADQMRIFSRHGKNRVVLATNVAETSLTVPGIRYVIDTGVARISRYSTRSKIQRLPVEPVSRASADQRKGRCGRIGPGVCIRLYDEVDFEQRNQFTDPEILRTNLASVILQMKAFRLGPIEEFPFIDAPDYRQIRDGYQALYELGALDQSNELTESGRLMARLPIDPQLARMILASHDHDCVREVLVIAAALAVQDPRDRPLDRQQAADAAHAEFRVGASDFLFYLNLWNAYEKEESQLSSSRLRKWCQSRFLSHQRMREWQDVHQQLTELAGDIGISSHRSKQLKQPAQHEAIHKALLTGMLATVGRRCDDGSYTGPRGKTFWLFPGSALFHRKPAWVMASEIVETTKVYARLVAEIKPEWIEEAAPHLVQRTYFEPHWQRKTGRVMAYEKVQLFGLQLFTKRPAPYETIDPKTSRSIFIHHALVEADLENYDPPFFRHNRTLQREVELLEARTRRRDILADAQSRFAFYDARIPAAVTGMRSFETWRKEAEASNRRLLWMSHADLMLHDEKQLGIDQFPNSLSTSVGEFPLKYHFEPGSTQDGVTVVLPLAALASIESQPIEWLVPGLLVEKIVDLIRTLPKAQRVSFVPAPDYARRAADLMTFGEGDLPTEAARALGKLTGLQLRADDFDLEQLDPYLRMNIEVHDEAGRFVAQGRSLAKLRESLRDRLRQLLAEQLDKTWHRDGLITWDVGDLPERVELRRSTATLIAFPGLSDAGASASLRLFDSPESARLATRGGVRRLFVIEYARELKWHIEHLHSFQSMALHFSPLAPAATLRQQLIEALAHRLISPDAAMVRTRMEYELQLQSAWNRLTSESNILESIAKSALASFHAITLKLAAKYPPLLQASIDDIRNQVRKLMPVDFLLCHPKLWTPHLPRFLRAVEVRLEKLLNAGVKRDCDLLLEIAPHLQRFDDLTRLLRPDEPLPSDLETYRWWVEEFRVQKFAQELKTSVPISGKRLDELWATIGQSHAELLSRANAPRRSTR